MNQNLQEIYAELEEVGNIVWWSLDLLNYSLTWSPKTYQIHGLSPNEDLSVESAIEFYLPKHWAKIQQNVENCIKKGTSFVGDHRVLNSGHHSREFFEDLWDTIQFGVPWRGQICNRAKNGELYWVETFIQPKRDGQGEISGYISLRYDITKQKDLEAEMKAQMENHAMMAQMASIGEFAGSIAQEISNPLTIISMVNDQMHRKYQDDKQIAKWTTSIKKATSRMDNIIQGMKSLLYRSTQDEFKTASINEVVKEMHEFSSEFLHAKGIDLRINYDDNEANLDCIDVQIYQVLINLVKNARDSILESGVKERWIQIDASRDQDFVQIQVSDSGPGIDESVSAKIMQTFFTTKEKGKGAGLGLSLVNRIIKKHNGTLHLKSNQLAIFVITLPREQISLKAA